MAAFVADHIGLDVVNAGRERLFHDIARAAGRTPQALRVLLDGCWKWEEDRTACMAGEWQGR